MQNLNPGIIHVSFKDLDYIIRGLSFLWIIRLTIACEWIIAKNLSLSETYKTDNPLLFITRRLPTTFSCIYTIHKTYNILSFYRDIVYIINVELNELR